MNKWTRYSLKTGSDGSKQNVQNTIQIFTCPPSDQIWPDQNHPLSSGLVPTSAQIRKKFWFYLAVNQNQHPGQNRRFSRCDVGFHPTNCRTPKEFWTGPTVLVFLSGRLRAARPDWTVRWCCHGNEPLRSIHAAKRRICWAAPRLSSCRRRLSRRRSRICCCSAALSFCSWTHHSNTSAWWCHPLTCMTSASQAYLQQVQLKPLKDLLQLRHFTWEGSCDVTEGERTIMMTSSMTSQSAFKVAPGVIPHLFKAGLPDLTSWM